MLDGFEAICEIQHGDRHSHITFLIRRKYPLVNLGVNWKFFDTENVSPEIVSAAKQYLGDLIQYSEEELLSLYGQELAFHKNERQAIAETEDKRRFFSKPEATADFEYYSKMPTWTFTEAIALLFGKDPHILTMDKILTIVSEPLSSPFSDKYMKISILALRTWDTTLEGKVTPKEFIDWAVYNDIEIHEGLLKALEDRAIRIATIEKLENTIEAKEQEVTFLKEEVQKIKDSASIEQVKTRNPLLAYLNEKEEQLWAKYDPKCPPKRESVIAELTGKKIINTDITITLNQAKAMDMIMRPQSCKKGGNKAR
jgi:hypothetical protein